MIFLSLSVEVSYHSTLLSLLSQSHIRFPLCLPSKIIILLIFHCFSLPFLIFSLNSCLCLPSILSVHTSSSPSLRGMSDVPQCVITCCWLHNYDVAPSLTWRAPLCYNLCSSPAYASFLPSMVKANQDQIYEHAECDISFPCFSNYANG